MTPNSILSSQTIFKATTSSRRTESSFTHENLIAPYYADWLEYQRQSPGRYKDKVRQSLADVEDAVGLGTCACGEIDSVRQELKGFVNRFPTAAVNGKIRDRIEQLDKDPWELPVRCT